MAEIKICTNAPPGLLRQTRTSLTELGFSEGGVQDRLALNSMSELFEASQTRVAHIFPLETPQDHLIALFIFGQSVPKKNMIRFLSQEVIDLLIQTGLVAELRCGILLANVFLLPFSSLLIVSDRHDYGQADEVWIPSGQTFAAAKFLPDKARHALDIATGNGILAMLMSRHAETVHGIDINPRAIGFARFNAWFNGCCNISFEATSYNAFAIKTKDKFDVITGVLPDLMVGSLRRPGPISRVVSDGSGLLNAIYHNLPKLLESGGLCVFWHGITASKESIGEFFEKQIIKNGDLPRGFEVVGLSAIKGGQETGVFLVKKGPSRLPVLFSRLSPSLGITVPIKIFDLTNARRWFHFLPDQEQQNVRLRISDGLLLTVEHRAQNGLFQGERYQIGRYRISPDVFELLRLVDGARSVSEIANLFLSRTLGDRALAENDERQRVEQTISQLVDKGILRPVAPAIADAIEDAASVRIRDLPAAAERVYAALHAAHSEQEVRKSEGKG